jgi:hypothetical protein
MFTPSFLSVVDCLKAMSFAPHATLKLEKLNYDTSKEISTLFLQGSPNEIPWIDDIVHVLTNDHFTPSPPHCKTCNVKSFCVNTCVVCMYYIVWKQENLTQVTIHLSTNEHMVVEGRCEKSLNKSKPWSKKRCFALRQQLHWL